jgi:topoisomerase-4 subunit A
MKIRGEQAALAEEQETLEKTLRSGAKLNKLIREEIAADAERYGDARRTRIVEREAAQAIDETELVTSEPVTVVLSTLGWVRQARGHDLDPRQLSYKTGDAFQAAARGRSTQQAVFVDSTGRAYALPAHTLPSARGQGEPLSGRLDPPEGATFAAVLVGEPGDRWLLACDAGHGFIAKLDSLFVRNRAGKSVFNLPENAKVLAAAPVPATEGALVVAVSSEGRMLAFPVADLP